MFIVNIKFPRVTYHTIVPSTEELLFKWCHFKEVVIIRPRSISFPVGLNGDFLVLFSYKANTIW